MSIVVGLHHITTYRYDRPVSLGPQVIRLRPAPHSRTRILSYALKILPANHFINWQQDPHGNWLARLVFLEKTTEFVVAVDFVADLEKSNPFNFFVESWAEELPFTLTDDLRNDLAACLAPEPACAALRGFLDGLPGGPLRTVDFLVALNQKLHGQIRYITRMEPGVQTPGETLTLGSGSCRDMAWLMVQVLRHLGVPARFVSGYLIQLRPDETPLDGPQGTDCDVTDLHAWAEAYLPGAGWIGLDPTSGYFTGEGHIALAAAPHYHSAAPVSGAVDAAAVDFSFEMAVSRLAEHPRVTWPFSDAAWDALDALGETVDADLAADVRLTMGGEPTFVSIDDYESPEWNIAALGPAKRNRAGDLIRRLRDRFAPQGLLHFTQGKWYPGEPLPRWALGLYWRRDGLPLWQDQALLAPDGVDLGATADDAQRFARGVAARMGIGEDHVVPAYEDPVRHMIEEGGWPDNIDPANPALDDPAERARIMRAFNRRLTVPAGFVLPLLAERDGSGTTTWYSSVWPLRRGYLFLVPGDSPLGLRLPLEALPYPGATSHTAVIPADPFMPVGDLPHPDVLLQRAAELYAEDRLADADPDADADAGGHRRTALEIAAARARRDERRSAARSAFVRTAFAVEPRDGQLCVFMPPVAVLDDYLELLAAVEGTARDLGLAIVVEGYPPPTDHRINVIKVTPDPGVIEVNIHPAVSWRDAVATTRGLYEDARLARLGTSKFMADGRHTGTGGGNHITLGGATPADSPFLRRPDLLRSIVLYWQRRPALSYLFSGLFIGPTSQAPRLDEARMDILHEAEVAMALVPPPGAGTPPSWLVDRLFRNLLVDVGGNTHRAEICIDKLFSPDGPAGRLGIVEFRSFEMPPDARMSLAQQLLLRALVAWFWKRPLTGDLVRWGTALHDRFMLEHYVWEDFLGVLDDLDREGYHFDPAWFAAQRQFRFPLYGEVTYGGVSLELRGALEPWHVLGEEGVSGQTARFVDSSVERLQVKLQGLNSARHVVTCNGRRLPLTATGRAGEAVAGVRFKAWSLPSALHPTIPAHTPLTFDIVDTWSSRSLGGCVYHNAHPGGRNYDAAPVNSYEAEARRRARFEAHGHTPGILTAIPLQSRSMDYPTTLDLRHQDTSPM